MRPNTRSRSTAHTAVPYTNAALPTSSFTRRVCGRRATPSPRRATRSRLGSRARARSLSRGRLSPAPKLTESRFFLSPPGFFRVPSGRSYRLRDSAGCMATTTTLAVESAGGVLDDPDLQLAARCLEGEERALRRLYERNVAAVHRVVRLNAGPDTSVDDLVQDTFVRALELLPRYRGDARLAVWLRGIALNLCRTQRRTAWRRRLLRRRVLPPADARTITEPECRLELQQLLTQIRALPDAEREAFVMCRVEQLSLADASTVIGAPKCTIGDRVQRADAKLRSRLAGKPNS